MKNFIKHFNRVAPGVWMCVTPADLDLPSGRIQVTPGTQFTKGTKFMGVELAKMLEDERRASKNRN